MIYDLFELTKSRSPQKTIHEVARSLNTIKESAFHNRLKMLGKRNEGQENATLSQGTFVKYLLTLISKNPESDQIKLKNNIELDRITSLPLREYFIDKEDDVIFKVLDNLFKGVKNAFTELWENPNNNILWKTTGFGAIVKSFNQIYNLGEKHNNLTELFFTQFFTHVKKELELKGIELTSAYFTSNEQQQTKLSNLIKSATETFKYEE